MFKKIFFCCCFFILFFTYGECQNKEIVFAHNIDTISFQGIENADSARYIIASKTYQFDSINLGRVSYMYSENDTLYAFIKATKTQYGESSVENKTWILCQLDSQLKVIKYKIYPAITYASAITYFEKKIIFYESDDDGAAIHSLSFNSDSISEKKYNYTQHEDGSFFIQNKDTLSLVTTDWIRIVKFDKTINKISEHVVKKPSVITSYAFIDKGKYYLLLSDGVNKNYNTYPIFSKIDKNIRYLSSTIYPKDTAFYLEDAIGLNDSLNVGFSADEIYFFKNRPEIIHKIIFLKFVENQHFDKVLKVENNLYFLMEYGTNMYLLKYNLVNQKMEWKLKLYRSYRSGPGGNAGPFGMFVKNNFLFIYGAESNEDLSNVYPKLLKIKM